MISRGSLNSNLTDWDFILPPMGSFALFLGTEETNRNQGNPMPGNQRERTQFPNLTNNPFLVFVPKVVRTGRHAQSTFSSSVSFCGYFRWFCLEDISVTPEVMRPSLAETPPSGPSFPKCRVTPIEQVGAFVGVDRLGAAWGLFTWRMVQTKTPLSGPVSSGRVFLVSAWRSPQACL